MINVTSLRKFKNTIFLHVKAAQEPQILAQSLIYGDLYDICDLWPLNLCACVCVYVKNNQEKVMCCVFMGVSLCMYTLKITSFIKRIP